MKKRLPLFATALFAGIITLLFVAPARGQQYDCNNTFTVFKMDFGDDSKPVELQQTYVRKFYNRINGQCPNDGEYSYVSSTSDCYSGHWFNVPKDHTPGSQRGRMMLVNAAPDPSPFFSYLITGLTDNAHYTFSAWFLNVCRPNAECTSTLPSIRATVSFDRKVFASLQSGNIDFSGPTGWKQYTGEFDLPAGVTSCVIMMETMANGGCGNDFAMDDVELRLCRRKIAAVKPVAVLAPPEKPIIKPVETKPVVKPVVKPAAPEPRPITKNNTPAKKEEERKPAEKPLVIKSSIVTPAPPPLQNRDNIIAKAIETAADELEIKLYDNGEIDGDTVSIFHNNMPLLMHKGLSDKPITFKISVNAAEPHHELVMVADNLGSIPPNTSVMIITSRNRRYEVSLSSSEKQNAKVVIDLIKE